MILKFIQKPKGRCWKTHISRFQKCTTKHSHWYCYGWLWQKYRHIDQGNRHESLHTNPYNHSQVVFVKYSRRQKPSFENWCWDYWMSTCKRTKFYDILHIKINSQGLHCGVAGWATPASHMGDYSNAGCSAPIQLPAIVPRKSVDDGPSAWVSVPMWETRRKLKAPGNGLAQPRLLSPLGEWTNEWEMISPLYVTLWGKKLPP